LVGHSVKVNRFVAFGIPADDPREVLSEKWEGLSDTIALRPLNQEGPPVEMRKRASVRKKTATATTRTTKSPTRKNKW
jgi:hypothetical protein